MIIYRPHKGMLDESMREAKEFESEMDMKIFIVDNWNNMFSKKLFDIDDIVIDNEFSSDDRNGWKDTRYVCINRCGDDDYMKLYGHPQCVGYCAADYKSNEE